MVAHSEAIDYVLGLVPFRGGDSGYVEVFGVLQLNVCAKGFIERFIDFLPSARPIGHRLFDADGFMALRALAEAVTGAIHLVPWPEPTYIGQFWPFHAVSFPQDTASTASIC
jgi:hypothetical protein